MDRICDRHTQGTHAWTPAEKGDIVLLPPKWPCMNVKEEEEEGGL